MRRPLPLLALLLLASGCLGGMPANVPENAAALAHTWTAADCSTRVLQFVSEAAPIQEMLPPGHEVHPILDQEAHPMAFNEFQVTSCTSLLLGNDSLVRNGAFALLSTNVRSEGPNSTFYALLVCSPSQDLVAAFASMGFAGELCTIEAGPTMTRVRIPDWTILVRHQSTADGVYRSSGALPRDYCKAATPESREVAHVSASRGLTGSVFHVGSVTFDGPLGAAIRPQPAAAYMDDGSGVVTLAFRYEPSC